MEAFSKALSGFRVLDFSQGIAGPYSACLLAEMGADVTKIEPPHGDWLRRLGRRRGDSSVLFATYNRGKKGLALDLKRSEEREIARRMIAQADVLVESNRPDVMTRLGFGYDAVRAINPAIVYASVTGFGQTGPYAEQPATDTAIQALTGFAFAAGGMAEPIRVRVAIVDVASGLYASHAILGALLQRARTGQGRHLDINLMHCMTAVQGYKYAEHEAAGGLHAREAFAGIGIYRTADGFIALSAMKEQHVLDLIHLVGRSRLLNETRFASPEARFENQDALRAIIGEALVAQVTNYWLPKMRGADLICQPVLGYDGYRADEHVVSQQFFQPIDLGQAGVLPAVRMPGLAANELRALPAPAIGEHSDEVLAGFGIQAPASETQTQGAGV